MSAAYPAALNPIQQALLQNAALMPTAQKEGKWFSCIIPRVWTNCFTFEFHFIFFQFYVYDVPNSYVGE